MGKLKSCEVVLYKGMPFIVKKEIKLRSGHMSLICDTVDGGTVSIPKRLTTVASIEELLEYMSSDRCKGNR